VLLNLLRNSAEAIGERGGRILIEARRTEQILQLIVSDDGPGYPDDLLHFGIRPFLSGNAKGTGLGLAIVRRLVKSVGGELHLANSDDGGACTTVTLPCKEPFSSREAPEQQRPFASHETTK
jgi:signal transduction histidine kinase